MAKKETFEFYRKELSKNGWTRFNVIEYRCGFPGIDPFEMAAALISDGVTIHFDDSRISLKENARKEKRAIVLARKLEAAVKAD